MFGVPVKQHTNHAVVDTGHSVSIDYPMLHSIHQRRLAHGIEIKGRDEESLPLLKSLPRERHAQPCV